MKYGIFEDISEIKYSIRELTRLFSEFQKGIEEINALEKKFKRKKYILSEDNKKIITIFREHLIKRENEYYEMLIDLITSDEEEEKDEEDIETIEYFKGELAFFVHNKYAIMQELYKFELDVKKEQEKK